MEDTIRILFDKAVQDCPGRVAVEYVSNGRRCGLTWEDLDKRIRNIAELIASLGIRPRTKPVALMLDNCPEWIESYLALCGTAISVVPMDPKLRPAEIVYILKDVDACAVITDAAHIPVFEEIAPDLPDLHNVLLYLHDENMAPVKIEHCDCISIEERLPILKHQAMSQNGRYASTKPSPDDVASIIYTSGSTGKPKGALLTNANFCTDCVGTLAGVKVLTPEDRFMVVLPLFHAFSFQANMLLAIKLQARLQFVVSLRSIGEDLRRYKPTVVMAVPLLVEKIAAKIENGIRTNRAMLLFQVFHLRGLVKHLILRSLGGSLRLIVTGGAPCSTKVITIMRQFGVKVIEGYGLTEASPIVSVSSPSEARVGTIGRPLPNIEAKIFQPNEQGVGELIIRGPIVMKGYINLPDATAETLIDGWLHTGDLASQDADGFLSIRGRKKALIVNREGKNIYPEEVEQCISHEKMIRDILVIGYHDQQEIGEKVGAIIVPNLDMFKTPSGEQLPNEEIEARIRAAVQTQCGNLATYKHPRKLEIRYEPLKRTAALKIERKLYQGQLDRVQE